MIGSPTARRLLIVHTWAVYLFLYGPIVVLVIFSFNRSQNLSSWGGLSLRWYGQLWRDEDIRRCAVNSLIVGGMATLFATVIGTLAALAMGDRRFIGKTMSSGMLYLPVVIPEIVFGAALLTFFSVTKWSLSMATVVIAHVTFSISYVAIVVRARLAGFDTSLEEAARDLGAGRFGTFFRVKLPLMMPGVIAGALLVLTLSIDDYVITSFVAGPESTTLPLLIASKLHVKSDLPVVNAAATVLLMFTVIPILLAQRLLGGKPARV